MLDEPLAHELLRQLLLGLALRELLFVAVGIEVATAVRRVNLVNEDDLSVTLAELVLRVNQDEPLCCGNLRTALEEGTRVLHHRLPVFLADQSLLDDFLGRDVLVVSFLSLCGRGDDGFWELLVLLHAFRKLHSAEFTAACFVLAPS